MIKIDVFIENGELKGTKGTYNPNTKEVITTPISEDEVIKIVNRIDEYRTQKYFRDEKELDENGKRVQSIRYIDNNKRFNVKIHTPKPTLRLIKNITKEKKKEQNKKTVKGVIASVLFLSIGTGFTFLIYETAKKAYDPEINYEELLQEDKMTRTQQLSTLDVNKALANIDENNLIQVNTEALDNKTVVNLDNNRVFDKGIDERNKPFLEGIKEKSAKWGIGEDLLYDILSSEYGGETDKVNICHVVFDSWEDQVLTAYNFDAGRYEKIVLTNTPDQYHKITADRSNESDPNAVDQTITPEELRNPDTSLAVACIILQYAYKIFDGNIPLTIQAYNNGVGGVNRILEETSKKTGVPIKDIIGDQSNLSWLDYTYVIKLGSKDYFLLVSSKVSDRYSIFNKYTIKTMKENIENNNEIIINLNGILVDGTGTPMEQFEDQEELKGRSL